MFKTISENVEAEIVEKKSKFIANIFYVESVEEAEEKIKAIKKKHYDARHNCYAFSIYTENGTVDRFSDDGEPSGTAGSPMLNILKGQNLSNILVVVTRYFGGILLGTGGLVRAYSDATLAGIANAKIVEKDLGIIASFIVPYEDLEKIKYYFKQENIKIIDYKYDENVEVFAEITKEKYQNMLKNSKNLKFKVQYSKVEKESFIKMSKNVE